MPTGVLRFGAALLVAASVGLGTSLLYLVAFDSYDLRPATVYPTPSAWQGAAADAGSGEVGSGVADGYTEPAAATRGAAHRVQRRAGAAQWIRSDPETSHFIDEHGRVRLFHGLNVVFKTPPHVPDPGDWTAETSFGPADAANLSAWGFNAIRLGVLWAGTFPAQRGVPDPGYMATVKQIVRTCEAHGIHVVLDMHSDVLSRRFCGNGMPDWAVDDALHASGMRPPYGDFPAPLQLEQAHFFKAAPEPAGGGTCGSTASREGRSGANRSSRALGTPFFPQTEGWCAAELVAFAAATTSSEVAVALEAAGLYPKLEACLERDFFRYYTTNVSTKTSQVGSRRGVGYLGRVVR